MCIGHGINLSFTLQTDVVNRPYGELLFDEIRKATFQPVNALAQMNLSVFFSFNNQLKAAQITTALLYRCKRNSKVALAEKKYSVIVVSVKREMN